MAMDVQKAMDHELLKAAFVALREPILIVHRDGDVVMANTACRRLLGLDEQHSSHVPARLMLRLVNEKTRKLVDFDVKKLDDADWLLDVADHCVLMRENGSEFPFDMTATPVALDGNWGWILSIKDLFHIRSLADTIHFQRSHDQLTGLCNRSEFERRLQDALNQPSNFSGNGAMAYVDVDQFKVVNDTCGHVAGDELLRQLTDLFRVFLQPGDILARIGGDEFGMLLHNLTLDEAKRRCESLRRKTEEHIFTWSDKSFSTSVSIGLVELVSEDQNWATLMGQADAACYHAKEAGRNQIRVYADDDAQVALRHTEMQWVSRIVQALQQNRFILYAQPIVCTRTRKPSHQEVLVRMIDTDGSVLPPGMFLPAAERFNLVLMLDKWVFTNTLQWLAAKLQAGDQPLKCAINLSGASIGQSQFHCFVEEELQRTGVPTRLLCFELTETVAINNLQNARHFIAQMKLLGIHFALDDFGAGMSSFAYLKNLSADYLKIDGIFVRELHKDPIDYAMVKSINEVGQVMGMKTVAEFVENEAILEKLQEIGVDYAQGYGVGKPVPLL